MSNSLAKETADLALDNIKNSLPKNISNQIKFSSVEQVFVWVLKNKNSANQLVTILEENDQPS